MAETRGWPAGAAAASAACSESKPSFGDVEGLHEVGELEDGGGAALLLLDPEEAGELGEAFVEPGLAGVNPGVGEGVGEGGAGGGGGQLVDGGDEEGVVLEGVAGVVEDGEGGERGGAEPLLEERGDALGGGGEGWEGGGVGGFDGEHVGGGLRWIRDLPPWPMRQAPGVGVLEPEEEEKGTGRGAAVVSGWETTKRLGWRKPRGWAGKSAVAMPVPLGAAGSSGRAARGWRRPQK